MKHTIRFLFFSCSLIAMSTNLYSANFFPSLTSEQVQQIFDDADKAKMTSLLINTSNKKIPAVQILPISDSPQTEFSSGTQCIKLYNCNQGICLVGLNDKKYATSESVLSTTTSEQKNSHTCQDRSKNTTGSSINSAFSWVKVSNVTHNDSLNVRQQQNYKSEKLGSLKHNATCIKRLRCSGKWCEITKDTMHGWVHRGYIEKMSDANIQSCTN